MDKTVKWQDDYWLFIIQLYLRKPTGIKPMYSRDMVELSLQLHIHPRTLYNQMCRLASLATPGIEHIWTTYSNNPRKLSKAINMLHDMAGFGYADEFYEGVAVNESFEKDFKPITDSPNLKPVHLIIILDLYFRLTPITMVTDTPEIIELAKQLHITPVEIVEIMDVYQHCDPYLNRTDILFSSLFIPCQQIWQRYGNSKLEDLASFASDLKEYFK